METSYVVIETLRLNNSKQISIKAFVFESEDQANAHMAEKINEWREGDVVVERMGTDDSSTAMLYKMTLGVDMLVMLKVPVHKEHKAEVIPIMDLDKIMWDSIKRAADESTWIPKEHYFMNDWVSDVVSFLKDGRG